MSMVQCKTFKAEFQCKNTKTKINSQKQTQLQNQNTLIYCNEPHLSPRKKPTSFRQLSGSKQKNTQLFSSKKKVMENKLNTLRNNERCGAFQEQRIQIDTKSSGSDKSLKQGLFSKLITTRSPTNIRRNLENEYQQKKFETATNKLFDVCFSTFRVPDFKNGNENICYNIGNPTLQKTISSDSQKGKGLKFKGFPHKKNTLQSQSRIQNDQQSIPQGLLIKQKTRSPLKQCFDKKMDQSSSIIKERQNRFLTTYQTEKSLSRTSFEADEVIRSREGSMTFDMSPTLQ